MTGILIGLAAAVALLGVLVVGLLRGQAEVLRVLHEQGVVLDPSRPDDGTARSAALPLPVARPGIAPVDGSPGFPPARDLLGTTPDDDTAAVGVTGDGDHVLLAFLSSQCVTCQTFWSAFAKGAGAQLPGGAELIVVTKDAGVEVAGEVERLAAPLPHPVVMSSAAWRDYEVPVSPYFVHVLGGRVVGTGAASSFRQVRDLLATSLAGGLRPSTTGHEGGRVAPRGDQDQALHVDAELARAGILPGDPRLWGPDGGGHDAH